MDINHYEMMNTPQIFDAIVAECDAQGLKMPEQKAYVLATVQWETAGSFRPVREAFWKSEEWRKNNFRYYPYYGRGFVQLTWEHNYKKYSDLLGVDMVANPDLALDSDIALFILVHGFKTGAFTTKKLENYINEKSVDFINARRCINGKDRASTIAKLANEQLERFDENGIYKNILDNKDQM